MIGFDIFGHPHICPYYTAVAYGDASQYCGIGVYYYIVADDRMAWYSLYRIAIAVKREALGSKRYTLVYLHIVADDTCCAYHYARTMVDCEVFAYRCLWMDVECAISVSMRGISGTPNMKSSWAIR